MKYVYVQDKKVKVISARQHKNTVIMLLDGVDSIEKAADMCGTILYVNRDDIVLEEGRYFVQDIIGCEVYDIDTKDMYGIVTDVFKTGANDVYQITDERSKNFLVPVIPHVVLEVDIEDRKIYIRPLKGIFDDED
jgi:16S rRNA processing protein RimM